MTKAELIKELEKYPDDILIARLDEGGDLIEASNTVAIIDAYVQSANVQAVSIYEKVIVIT